MRAAPLAVLEQREAQRGKRAMVGATIAAASQTDDVRRSGMDSKFDSNTADVLVDGIALEQGAGYDYERTGKQRRTNIRWIESGSGPEATQRDPDGHPDCRHIRFLLSDLVLAPAPRPEFLNSPRKLARWPFVLLLAFFVIQFSVGLISAPGRPEETIGATAALLLDLLQLPVGILIVVQCFFIKDILEEHLMGPEVSAPSSLFSNEAKLSGAMTFFFTIFYLQHVINREVLQPPPVASPSLDPAPEIA
jgi:hypothetical protein